MRPYPRRIAALVAVMAMVVMTAPFVTPAAAATCGGRIVDAGLWRTIRKPDFSSGGKQLTAYGVDPLDAGRLYASNGTVVAVSKDGGCKWKETFAGDGLPAVPGSSYVVSQILTPSPDVAVLMIDQRAGSSRPAIVISKDGGQSWTQGGAGLPPNGQPEMIVAPTSSPATLYLALDVGGGALDFIYVSTDSGSTWLLRSDLSALRADAGIQGISVDELNPQWVWAWGTRGLYQSTNGGATFSPVDDFVGEVTAWLAARGGEDMVFLPAATPNPKASTSKNNGANWFRIGAPGSVTSSVHGPASDQIVMTAAGAVYAYHGPSFKWFDLQAPRSGVTDARLTYGAQPSVFVRTTDAIMQLRSPDLDGTLSPPGAVLPGRNTSLLEDPDLTVGRATLSGSKKRIELKQGETKTVSYELDLPERPVPLDVYFLVDSSSSMTRTINGLATSLEGIINGLRREKIDVQFGLAEYRSYPSRNPPRDDLEKNFVYRQDVDIPAPTAVLEAAIEDLEAEAGGFYDAHLGALYQAATGAGQDVWPRGVQTEGDVPPGLQADFRAKGLRVIINATDEAFGSGDDSDDQVNTDPTSAPPPEIPSVESVVAKLNEKDIKHVGLSIGRAPVEDMQEVSRGTSTFATEPVDCDGDGSVDLTDGDPLVCFLRSHQSSEGMNLVPAVVGLLRAIQERAPVALEVERGEAVVRNISPDVYDDVVLQTASTLEFEVKYHCSENEIGERFPVKLRATSPDPEVKLNRSIKTTVVCTEEPADLIPVLPLIPPLVAIGVPPPPPPPAPVSQMNPATQAQSQAQAQGAAAHQEQEEPQLAMVTAFDAQAVEEEGQFAMTAYRDRRRLPAEAYLGVGAVALGMMMSAAFALRRRHQLRYQRQRY